MQWNARPITLALALFAAANAHAQDADPTATASGPHGTSQLQPGDSRYDAVGYAAVQSFGAAALAISRRSSVAGTDTANPQGWPARQPASTK